MKGANRATTSLYAVGLLLADKHDRKPPFGVALRIHDEGCNSVSRKHGYYLHAKALKAKPGLVNDKANIRYYTLPFAGSKYVFWVIEPALDDGRWNGCTMKRPIQADCTEEGGVRELKDISG